MRHLALTALLPLAIVAAGCSEQPEDSAATAAPARAEAPAEPANPKQTAFLSACIDKQQMDRSTCECIARRAISELNDNAFAFVVATLNRDRPEIRRLQDSLDMQDALAAGRFMSKTPDECAEKAG